MHLKLKQRIDNFFFFSLFSRRDRRKRAKHIGYGLLTLHVTIRGRAHRPSLTRRVT